MVTHAVEVPIFPQHWLVDEELILADGCLACGDGGRLVLLPFETACGMFNFHSLVITIQDGIVFAMIAGVGM